MLNLMSAIHSVSDIRADTRMQLINFLGVVLLIGLAVTAPVSENNDDEKLVVSAELFIDEFLVYTSEHDIVSLTVPLNSLNFDDDEDDTDDSDSDNTNTDITVFFVEADVSENGQKEYKGLYALRNGIATKVLETGTDSSASNDDTTDVYISAKDGIYVFSSKTNKTEKYGTVTDSLIGIAKANGSDVLYVLTEDHDVYKVTDNGNKKEKLVDVKDAQQIVLDYSNNLYFYGNDKVPYVVTESGVIKIVGIPENPKYVQLIKPPFIVEDGVAFAADENAYIIYVNGTSEPSDFLLQLKPTAYAPEATLIQYYAYNKKIYEYNILQIVFGELLSALKKVLEDKIDVIQSIATRSRSELTA